MNIVHTVASVEEEAAGPSYSVPSLAAALRRAGQNTEVVALGDGANRIVFGSSVVSCARDRMWPKELMRLGRSRVMREHLLNSNADVFHAHGLWMMPGIYTADAARRLNRPLILAPRGMLGRDALKFSSSVKQAFWTALQKRACDQVSCFHATAESEHHDIRAFGLMQPVAIVPNGIDLPVLSELESREASRSLTTTAPFILSLGRIHPKKGLDRLIAAFAQVAHDHEDWELKIIGPDEGGHADQLSRLATAAGLQHRVFINLPVYGQEKFRLMRQAEIFVLATLHENFGMTVAESLAVETPVVSTKGAPWAGLEVNGCGLWVEHSPDAIAKGLRELMSMPRKERQKMGARGRAWMQRDFGWDGIAAKMFDVYSWQLGLQAQPDWVRD